MPWWKRSIDLTVSLAALPFLAACTVLMAALHAAVSPGPVFYTQERVGRRGRRFVIFKFRTMRVQADTAVHQDYFRSLMASNAPMVKLDRADPRLIPGARLIRAVGFDELPQLLNVLLGHMTVVGPRPCLPSEYAGYLPEQLPRLEVHPGLTGLWQVSGKNRLTFAEMIRLDIEYARARSPWLDLKIILLTLPALAGQVRDVREARRRAASSAPPTEAATLPAAPTELAVSSSTTLNP